LSYPRVAVLKSSWRRPGHLRRIQASFLQARRDLSLVQKDISAWRRMRRVDVGQKRREQMTSLVLTRSDNLEKTETTTLKISEVEFTTFVFRLP